MQFLPIGDIFVVEESIVDREAKSVEVYMRNITFTATSHVVEKCVFTISPLNSKWYISGHSYN